MKRRTKDSRREGIHQKQIKVARKRKKETECTRDEEEREERRKKTRKRIKLAETK